MSKDRSRSECRFYNSEQLQERAEAMGCCLRFARAQGVFELTIDDKQDQNWTWVMRPGSNERVRLVRELTRDEWDQALANARKALLLF
ncbi:hypothetical protein CJP72_12340 [Citrobacter sp. NCU1]|uniref:hypothetical protein n=1 Tax=Citrobacter sp. NCU1 TaxID=2026683 RepID=UPI001391E250|nr:hypothetical protein [Citrobacter sp. NCU1]NDO81525.1 hypothetical protein [Citrobacter sp. NCU1]